MLEWEDFFAGRDELMTIILILQINPQKQNKKTKRKLREKVCSCDDMTHNSRQNSLEFIIEIRAFY